MKNFKVISCVLSVLVSLLPALAAAAGNPGDFVVTQVSERASVIAEYGNAVVLNTNDGAVLIDSNIPDPTITPKFIAALRGITGATPVKYVFVTHWHPDHIGANPVLTPEATVIAHENTLKRMSDTQVIEYFGMTFPAWPQEFLPEIALSGDATVTLGKEAIQAVHFPNAHTDSDLVLIVPSEKLVVMGDILIADYFPFVDIPNGGSVLAQLAAYERLVTMIPDDFTVVPGHGEIKTGAYLKTYRDMLDATVTYVKDGLKQRMTLKQLQDRGLPYAYDSFSKGPTGITNSKYIEFIYRGLRAQGF